MRPVYPSFWTGYSICGQKKMGGKMIFLKFIFWTGKFSILAKTLPRASLISPPSLDPPPGPRTRSGELSLTPWGWGGREGVWLIAGGKGHWYQATLLVDRGVTYITFFPKELWPKDYPIFTPFQKFKTHLEIKHWHFLFSFQYWLFKRKVSPQCQRQHPRQSLPYQQDIGQAIRNQRP